MDEVRETAEGDRTSRSTEPRDDENPSTLDFSFSFGLPASHDDPRLEELLEEAKRSAAASPDRIGSASRQIASLEFADGKLRVGVGEGRPVEYELGLNDPGIQYRDPFPELTMLRQWFNRVVTLLAIAIPVTLAILGIATGQTLETVFYMTIFGLIISTMLISSFRPRRTWLSDLLSDYLSGMARRQRATRTGPSRPQDPPLV